MEVGSVFSFNFVLLFLDGKKLLTFSWKPTIGCKPAIFDLIIAVFYE